MGWRRYSVRKLPFWQDMLKELNYFEQRGLKARLGYTHYGLTR
jgi:hypothetical protein